MTSVSGSVDVLVGGKLYGWADHPDAGGRLRIDAWIGDRLIGSGMARIFRPDLRRNSGYEVPVSALPSAAELARGALRVEASGDGVPTTLLQIHKDFPGDAGELAESAALLTSIADLPMPVLMKALAREHAKRPATDPFAGLIPDLPSKGVMSHFALPVGHVSADGVAVVGREGQLFLWGGSNDLASQYREGKDPAVEDLARSWCALFTARAEALAERGILYRQMILPEKSSYLSDLFPVPIQPPTPLFAAVEREIAASPMAGCYVPVLETMRGHPDRVRLANPVDTHFSSAGYDVAFGCLLSSIGESLPAMQPVQTIVTVGDLSVHFPGVPLCSVDRVGGFPELDAYGEQVKQVELVRTDGHLGTRLVLRNPGAALDRKVLVFGNSFFNYHLTRHALSFWMSRWFSEYHFHWSTSVDLEVVDRIKPDIVVAQTIERFLPRLPER